MTPWAWWRQLRDDARRWRSAVIVVRTPAGEVFRCDLPGTLLIQRYASPDAGRSVDAWGFDVRLEGIR